MFGLIILKPGPATNKGIQVGDSLQKVVNTYGSVYKTDRKDIWEHDPATGYFQENQYYVARAGNRKVPYFLVTYFEREKKRLTFIINKNSERVMAIFYMGHTTHDPFYTDRIGNAMESVGLWRFVI